MDFVRGQPITGFPFGLVDKSTGDAITSGTVSVYVTLDGGTQFQTGHTPVHEGNGQWTTNFTGTETDGDLIGIAIVHVDAIPQHFTVQTIPDVSSTALVSVTITSSGTSISNNFEYYGTLPSADLYFENRLNSECWEQATIKERQNALIQATRAIEKLNYEGFKNDPNQPL